MEKIQFNTIMDYINVDCLDFDKWVTKALKNSAEYQEAEKAFYSAIRNFDFKLRNEIESAEITMETMAREAAFQSGFNAAVRLLMGAMKE